ncbi:MAG TPA: hypothetical protein VJP86_02485 [Vicinamibacterales bacterium]|nr:hypothetical protein [Vicinamibacterales bacterium]
MALILAIEPDKRQASRITAIAREDLHEEIVICASADQALEAIDKRTPDLILTPHLLSPKDEAALDGRLRQLDTAGLHVQTLMIPVLSSMRRGGGKKDGILGRLRRGKDEPDTNGGCDPAVFASQIKEYLERAAEEREMRRPRIEQVAASERQTDFATTAASSDTSSSPETWRETIAPAADHSAFTEPADSSLPKYDPYVPKTDAYVSSVGSDQTAEEEVVQYAAPPKPIEAKASIEPEPTYEPPFESPVHETYQSPVDEPVAYEPPADHSAARYESVTVAHDEPLAFAEDEPNVEDFASHLTAATPATEVALSDTPPPVYVDSDITLDPGESSALAEPTIAAAAVAQVEPAVTDPFHEFVEFDDLSVMDAPMVGLGELETAMSANFAGAPAGRAEETVLDALELMDSPDMSSAFDLPGDALSSRWVPSDFKSTESEPEPSADDFDFEADLWMPLPLAAARRWPTLEGPNLKASLVPGFDTPPDEPVEYAPAPKKNSKKKPVQDEWGMFDPVQCGFAALLAKLDEVTDKDETAGEPTPAA